MLKNKFLIEIVHILLLSIHSYLNVNRHEYARMQIIINPLEFDFTAVLITRIINTPNGRGMKPIRRETMSE